MSNPLDFSRWLHQPGKHYTGARMQQGRVLLDSDFNEQAELDAEDHKRTVLDVIGAAGSPDQGFALGGVAPHQIVQFQEVWVRGKARKVINPEIQAGTFYLGGMRFELEQPERLLFQRDYLQVPEDELSDGREGNLVTFFHGFEQAVSAVEDDELREKALGGPDTSGRVRRMRRVEWRVIQDAVDCKTGWERVRAELEADNASYDTRTGELKSKGRLRVGFVRTGLGDNECGPCEPTAEGRYLGAENQAIRVMLTGPDRYVWAYDNGAPLYRVERDGPIVHLLTPPKDAAHYPVARTVVEFLPFGAVLENGQPVAEQTGVLALVEGQYDPAARAFKIRGEDVAKLSALTTQWDKNHPATALLGSQRFMYMRMWHVLPEAAQALDLDGTQESILGSTGMTVQVKQAGRLGDTWIITARPDTPEELLPWHIQDEAGVPPHGPRHFYAPLGVLAWLGSTGEGPTVQSYHDCRPRFRPLTEQAHCCTYRVGDGERSHGDFTSIQAAIDALPASGGKVCILPGVYREQVRIQNRVNVRIEGCGVQSRLESPTGQERDAEAPLIAVVDSAYVWIHELTLTPRGQVAVATGTRTVRPELSVRNLELERLLVLARASEERGAQAGIDMRGVVEARIARCDVLMDGHIVSDDAALFVQGLGISVEHNRVATLACVEDIYLSLGGELPPLDSVPIDGGGEILISPPPGQTELKAVRKVSADRASFRLGEPFPSKSSAIVSKLQPMRAWGGIQVGSGSVDVVVRRNQVEGGLGHGITLGHVHWVPVGGELVRFFGPGFRVIIRNDCDDWGGWPDPQPLPDSPDGPGYLPRVAGDLYRVQLLDNQITGMLGNGIGVLSVLVPGLWDGVYGAFQSFGFLDGTIRGNQIRRNVQGGGQAAVFRRVVDDVPGELEELGQIDLPDFVFGGVVLGGVERTTIADNVIEDNGLSDRVAVCGLFVLTAEDLTVRANRITNNGVAPAVDNKSFKTTKGYALGIRGGIFVGFALSAHEGRLMLLNTPALRVHDNVVDQPVGRALRVHGVGPMSVCNNHFTSHLSPLVEPMALGGAVEIVNLGIPIELMTLLLGQGLEGAPDTKRKVPSMMAAALRTGASELAFQVDIESIAWGGAVDFSSNQVFLSTRQLPQLPPPAPTQSFLLTLDSLTCQGNHFTSMVRLDAAAQVGKAIIRPRPALITSVYGLATTIQCSANRVSELMLDSQLSMVTVASQNVTMGNNATHCIFVLGYKTHDSGNFELDDANCERGREFNEALLSAHQQLAYAVIGIPQQQDGERPYSYFDPILARQAAAGLSGVVMLRSALIWKKHMLQRLAALESYPRLPRLSRGLCSHPIELPSEVVLTSTIQSLELRQVKLRKVGEQAVLNMGSLLEGAAESYAGVVVDPGATAGVDTPPEKAAQPSEDVVTGAPPEQASKAKGEASGSGETPPVVSKPATPVSKSKVKSKAEKEPPVDEDPAPPKKPSEES